MASNNRDPVVGSVDNDNSPIVQRAIAFGKAIPDLVKECERAGEARASSRLASKIDQQESTIKTLEGWFKLSEENNAELKECLTASEKQIACLRRLLTVSKKRTAEVKAKAQVDADARIAQHTSDLEARNAQMVETVAETVEKLKRDAAARVAAAETHSQDCIDEYRDNTDSQFRQLSRELDRHIDMLGLARKHTGWVAHKLFLLQSEVKKNTRVHNKTALADCLKEMFEELAKYRNDCDVFLDNGLVDDGEPDWGPVPDDEGGALLNRSYGKSSIATPSNNIEERTNQPRAPVSHSNDDTHNEQASREQGSLFVDDQQSDRGNQSFTIKIEDGDDNQQILSGLSPSTKRASDSDGQAKRGGKRQRTK
ncbi:hypothetical protein FPRO05_11408 [Fusarium proliferatum]|uniref:Uncharacterized protein n=1 Tax=Gibberella intermedia TaxID=948311 RepID=A0A365NA47_GIBIN|nr:hypothetical protein FPRO05_11408 [Fusarium proliferatum]